MNSTNSTYFEPCEKNFYTDLNNLINIGLTWVLLLMNIIYHYRHNKGIDKIKERIQLPIIDNLLGQYTKTDNIKNATILKNRSNSLEKLASSKK